MALCYLAYRFWLSSPAAVSEAVLYNSVFDGILRDSPSPREDLEALGLNPEWAVYAGSTAFAAGSLRFKPEFAEHFLKKINLNAILRFYLYRPKRLWQALQRGLEGSLALRPPQLGNDTKSAGKPPGAKSYSWAMWSTLRTAVLPRSAWFLLLIIASYLAALAKDWRKSDRRARRLAIELGLMVPFMALQQLLLISIADGTSDLVKHGFLFNLLVDIMLVVLIAYGWSIGIEHHARVVGRPSNDSSEIQQ